MPVTDERAIWSTPILSASSVASVYDTFVKRILGYRQAGEEEGREEREGWLRGRRGGRERSMREEYAHDNCC